MATLISTRMEALNLTDAALAAKVDCERSMVTKIKLGKATPSLPLAVRLSQELDLPPETFLPEKASAA